MQTLQMDQTTPILILQMVGQRTLARQMADQTVALQMVGRTVALPIADRTVETNHRMDRLRLAALRRITLIQVLRHLLHHLPSQRRFLFRPPVHLLT